MTAPHVDGFFFLQPILDFLRELQVFGCVKWLENGVIPMYLYVYCGVCLLGKEKQGKAYSYV